MAAIMVMAGLVLLAAVAAPAHATDYTVGDSSGWTSGVDYSTWSSGKTFAVGDNLVFQYSALHSVAEVSSADYSACSASNSIKSYSDQNTKIALTAAGTRYFICGTPGHCGNGMKLAVTIAAAAGGTTPPPASSTPTTPAAPGADDTPPESSTPSTSTPTATSPPATTKPTSSGSAAACGVEARLAMGMLAGAAGLAGLALVG